MPQIPPYEEWKRERLNWWEKLAMKLTPTDEFLDYMNLQLEDIRRLLGAAPPGAPPVGIPGIDALIAAVNSLIVTLGGKPAPPRAPTYQWKHIEVPSMAVAANETEQLWRTEVVGEKGALAWLKLVSDSSAVKYRLFFDSWEWVIDVAAMVNESIDRHIPLGAYIEKSDSTFVVMVSGGAGLGLSYEKELIIKAENTGATEINVTKTELLRKVMK